MSIIFDLCNSISSHLTRIGSKLAQYLQPGLDNYMLELYQDRFPYIFPDSLVELFRWKNGTIANSQIDFFPESFFYGLDASLTDYNNFLLCFESESFWNEDYLSSTDSKCGGAPIEDIDYIWHSRWLPIFPEVDASTYGIVCGDDHLGDGEIVHYAHTIGTERAFLGLEAMLSTIESCYQNNVVNIDSKGNLVCDYMAFSQIANQKNPGVELWIKSLRS